MAAKKLILGLKRHLFGVPLVSKELNENSSSLVKGCTLMENVVKLMLLRSPVTISSLRTEVGAGSIHATNI